MSLGLLFRMMYWSFRKDQAVWRHLLAVLTGWLANLIRLRVRRLGGGRLVAIGMVEHLGDIVAAEPVSRFARLQYPNAEVVWVARKPYASVPARFSAVDAVIEVTCLTEWLLLRTSGVGQPAWDLHINQRYCPLCQAPVVKIGAAAAISAGNYYEFGNLLAVQCRSADLPILTHRPELPLDAIATEAAARLDLPARLIVIHCTSNEPSRDWPRENWLSLLSCLMEETDFAVAEVGLRAVAVTQSTSRRRSLCGTLSLQVTAEVIRQAKLFIGIDSGPAHLANAVGTPGVILLGEYKGFRDYMPFSGGYADGKAATIVRAGGAMSTLPVARVWEAARQRLYGSPHFPQAPIRPKLSPQRHRGETRDVGTEPTLS